MFQNTPDSKKEIDEEKAYIRSKKIQDIIAKHEQSMLHIRLLYYLTQVRDNTGQLRNIVPISLMMCDDFLIKKFIGMFYFDFGNKLRKMAHEVDGISCNFPVAKTFDKEVSETIMNIARTQYDISINLCVDEGYIGLGLSYCPYRLKDCGGNYYIFTEFENIEEAMKYFSIGCQLNIPEAYKYLARLYFNGHGVQMNEQDSYECEVDTCQRPASFIFGKRNYVDKQKACDYYKKALDMHAYGSEHHEYGFMLERLLHQKDSVEEYVKVVKCGELESFYRLGKFYYGTSQYNLCEKILRECVDKFDDKHKHIIKSVPYKNVHDRFHSLRNMYSDLKYLYLIRAREGNIENDDELCKSLDKIIREYHVKHKHPENPQNYVHVSTLFFQ